MKVKMRKWVMLKCGDDLISVTKKIRLCLEILCMQGFSDTSRKGYGAWVYVGYVFESRNVQVMLHTSKSNRITLKVITIPR